MSNRSLGKLIIILIAAILIAAGLVAATKPSKAPESFAAKLSEQLEVVETVLDEDHISDASGTGLDQELTEEKTVQTDYVDANGDLTFAWDLHYASILKTLDPEGRCIREMYYDENRDPMRKSNGCYGTAFENDADGHPVRYIYLDADEHPTTLSAGYSILCRTYNEQGRAESDTYFDAEMQPVLYNGYCRVTREYDEDGNAVLLRYLDEQEKPVRNSSGYAVLERDCDSAGHIIAERYFDENHKPVCSTAKYAEKERSYSPDGDAVSERYFGVDGTPVLNNLGYSGVDKELDPEGHTLYEKYYDVYGNAVAMVNGYYALRNHYNELGQNDYTEYLDSEDEPVLAKLGYAGIRKTYARDGSVQEEFYYDENGDPVKVRGNYYGIRHDGKKTTYLDEDGRPVFIFNLFLLQNPWVSYALMLALCLVCFVVPKWARIILCILYVVFILYMTLFTREAAAGSWNFDIIGSYARFLSVEHTRTEMLENIALFIPFGLLLRSIWKSGWTIAAGVAFSCVIELIQGFTGLGGFELNDIINNSLGMVIGFLIVLAVEAICRSARTGGRYETGVEC